MSRPRNPSYNNPTARRPSRSEDDTPELPSSLRTSSTFRSTNNFIRRMTVRSSWSTTNPEANHLLPRRRTSFSEFWDGTGPNGLICVHNPTEPLVDLIFVHGLHGGSFKTWRKKEEKGYFWPGEWLANDSEFQNVRIHTFGYPADWDNFKASNLNVRDFGSSLYAALISSPYVNREKETSIILVGHSMGGLVIKRACLIASQAKGANYVDENDTEMPSLADRIKCLMFLGTPHHGSNSADLLDKILRSGASLVSAKDYVKDLKRESLSIQSINDEFRYIANNFSLYSVYETRQVPGLGYVVDKDSACIGGPPHEVILPVDSDHRGICKFDNEDDPNYRIIHDILLKVVDDLIGYSAEPDPDNLDPLDIYLDCEESQDEGFETILEQRVPGSCQWIRTRKDFIPWMQNGGQPVWLYWLHALPGTGKSVMAASVIKMLKDQDRDVSYFFFVNGNKYHRSVASLLRSIAFQMAQKQQLVEEGIREMQHSGVQWDEADEKLIWRKLFANCILKLPLKKPQYWIIDALDESADSAKLWPLLKSIQSKFNVRVFLTSRTSADIRKQFKQVGSSATIRCVEDTILPEDTQDDIRRLLKDKESAIPGDDEEDRTDMLHKLVQRSQGSFLWANVVLKEMESAYSKEDVETILDEVPSEMVSHYKSIFKQMSEKNARKKPLIHAMLTWAVCGIRPLQEAEFQHALRLDIEESITGNIERTVEGLCSQILTVNKQKAVQVVHSTVGEFLLDKENEFEYSIRREEGNLRLAVACLNYLTSAEMRPEGRLHLLTESQSIVQRVSDFADYAATAFSVHLVNSPSDNDELFSLLGKFLLSPNVLCWIEYVAQKHGSLVHIKEAGANLKRFMERRAKHLPPFGPGVELVKTWSTDLLRVVSKFGRNILEAPAQLPLLVPPICPRNSAIHTQFSRRNPGFQVVGIAEKFWADAISYIEHLGSYPSAMTFGPRYMAVGKVSGEILLFNNETFEELGDCKHREKIETMKFSNSGNILVTSGPKSVKLWSLENGSADIIWTKPVNQPCTAFFFGDDDETLVAASSGGVIFNFSTRDDENDDDVAVNEIQLKAPANPAGNFSSGGVLKSTSFSPDGRLVALAYEDQPISIWSVKDGTHLGLCSRKQGSGPKQGRIERLLFNPNPELDFIVVTYQHGELSLVDYHNLTEVRSKEAEPFALAATPDGHTLATGDAKGKIQLWDFTTLSLLYVINYHSSAVRDLRFSKDGLKLVDLRETHSVIWEPAALIRNNDDEDTISTSGTSVSNPVSNVPDYDDPIDISCLALHPTKPIAIAGKEDGSVDSYDLVTGKKLGVLFALEIERITHVALHQKGLLACACSGNKVTLSILDDDEDGNSISLQESFVLINDFGEPIRQLLFSDSGNAVLIAGARTTQICRCNRGRSEAGIDLGLLAPSSSPDGECWRYLPDADEQDAFRLFDKTVDALAKTDDPQHRKLKRSNTLEGEKDPHIRLRTAVIDPGTGYLILEYEGSKATRQVLILERTTPPLAEPDKLSPPAIPFPADLPLPPSTTADTFRLLLHLRTYQVKMFLGLHDGKVVYLGPHLWVRTVDLHHLSPGAKPVKRRHFFVPHEYIGGNHHVQAVVGRRGEVVFPRRGELAVVRGGFDARRIID